MASRCCRVGSLVTLAMLLSVTSAWSAGLRTEKDAVGLAETAMKRIVLDDIEGAIDILRPYASIEWGEFNIGMKRIADAFGARPGGFGEPLGYADVKEEALGGTLLHVTFIEQFRRKPLTWDFFFYKPEQDWLFWSVRFTAAPALMFNLEQPQQTPGPAPR